MTLIGHYNKLKESAPKNIVDQSCFPIQIHALLNEIATSINYLRRWGVNIEKVIIK